VHYCWSVKGGRGTYCVVFVDIVSVYHALVIISRQILGAFHCSPVCGSERLSWSLRNEAPTIWRHVGNSWYQPAGVRTRWLHCRIAYSNQNLVLTKSCHWVKLNRRLIRLSPWYCWALVTGSYVRAWTQTMRWRSNLTRFSQFQLNLNTLWCGKWCRLTEIAVSSSVKSKHFRRFSMSKCDVGVFFGFGRAAELVRSCLFKRCCSALAVWMRCLAVPRGLLLRLGMGFCVRGLFMGFHRPKQRAHSCSSP
jgi:hypothetical protein